MQAVYGIWAVLTFLVVISEQTNEVEESDLDFKVIGDSIITEVIHPNVPNVPTEPRPIKVTKVGMKEPEGSNTTTSEVTGAESDGWGQGVTGDPVPAIPSPNWVTSYPWLASIQRNNKQICTGTLINKEYVLTTAYCLFQLTMEELAELEIGIGFKAAPLGKNRDFELIKGPYTTLKTKKSIRHLRFSPTTGYNDIGMLQLITPVSDPNVEPVELVQKNDPVVDTAKHHLVGWRDGQDLTEDEVTFWRHQVSQGISLEKCREGYVDILDPQGISAGMMCSGGDIDATSCRWKFGTPLMYEVKVNSTEVKLIQLGMFSWGSEALLPECRFSAEKPSPMVFTRVTLYHDWIQKNINVL